MFVGWTSLFDGYETFGRSNGEVGILNWFFYAVDSRGANGKFAPVFPICIHLCSICCCFYFPFYLTGKGILFCLYPSGVVSIVSQFDNLLYFCLSWQGKHPSWWRWHWNWVFNVKTFRWPYLYRMLKVPMVR